MEAVHAAALGRLDDIRRLADGFRAATKAHARASVGPRGAESAQARAALPARLCAQLALSHWISILNRTDRNLCISDSHCTRSVCTYTRVPRMQLLRKVALFLAAKAQQQMSWGEQGKMLPKVTHTHLRPNDLSPDHHPKISSPQDGSRTLLHIAATNGRSEAVQMLLEQQAMIGARSKAREMTNGGGGSM